LTGESEKEIQRSRRRPGARRRSRQGRAELFGSQAKEAEGSPGEGRTIEASVTPGIRAAAGESTGARLRREDLVDRGLRSQGIERGVVLNAAVILDDPRKLDQASRTSGGGKRPGSPARHLVAEGSGLVGSFVTMMRGVLFTAVLIIFVVALVIINNALVWPLSSGCRSRHLRALGAQRRFVLTMMVFERWWWEPCSAPWGPRSGRPWWR